MCTTKQICHGRKVLETIFLAASESLMMFML